MKKIQLKKLIKEEIRKTLTEEADFAGLQKDLLDHDSKLLESILKNFEKVMADSKLRNETIEELKNAPPEHKERMNDIAVNFLPEKREEFNHIIDGIEDGSLSAEMLGMSGNEKVIIDSFNKGMEIIDYAIAFINKHMK